MNKVYRLSHQLILLIVFFVVIATAACNEVSKENKNETTAQTNIPVYFLLRPELEKKYGYSHAVKIGDDVKISGAVSMNDSGIIVAPANMEQQMKNCYSDLEKILQHYGYTFDDVYAENIYTTDMKEFIRGFRLSQFDL
jgi:2-iminobutanoate/2-iminopropanoate deaminase